MRKRRGWFICRIEMKWNIASVLLFRVMAGMLPGVECARRRRLGRGSSTDLTTSTRRSSFCLYATGTEAHLASNISMQRTILNKEIHEGALGQVARKARERLDARLRIKRHRSLGRMKTGKNECSHGQVMLDNLQREVFSSKRRTKKFCWSKLGWKALGQAECAVCLEEFKKGDVLLQLPCAHRFHQGCVVPWLESNSHCPFCRMAIFSERNC